MQRLVGQHGPNLFYELGREPAALLQRPQGAAADAAPRRRSTPGSPASAATSGRRRTDIRKIEIDHDHGAIVKLNPLAEWTEDEVWDYVRENDVPTHPLYEQGLHVDRLRAVHARDRAGRGRRARAAGGGRRTRRRSAGSTARSRPAGSSTSCTRSSGRTRDDDAVALGRRGARGGARRGAGVLAIAGDPRTTATQLACLIAAIEEGEVPRRERRATLEQILELGAAGGRIRALYGPGGETGRAAPLPPAPARRGAAARAPREVSEALARAAGPRARAVAAQAVGPGAFTLSLADGEGRAHRPARPPGRPARDASRSDAGAARYYMACLDLTGTQRARRRRRPGRAREGRRACSPSAPRSRSSRREIVPELARARRRVARRAGTARTTSTGASSSSRRPRRRRVNRRVFRDAESALAVLQRRRRARALLASSSPPSTARSRSRSPSRPAAPRRRSRSGSATQIGDASCARARRARATAARAAARGRSAPRRPTRSARSTSQRLVEQALG